MRALPKWAERFLRTICPDEFYEQIAGDLLELYDHDVKTIGKRKANWKLALDVIRFFRPGIVARNRFTLNLDQGPMIQHYLKTSFRHFFKSRLNVVFKVLGLSLAFLSLLVIVLYVSYQLSFDRFYDDYENIYRVNAQWRENGEMVDYAAVPIGVGQMLKREFPEVRSYTRMGGASRCQVRFNDKSFHAEGIMEADSSVFDVLSFEFIHGNGGALKNPGSIVLTESLAKQIFADSDPIGNSITFVDRGGIALQVTAVVKDLPSNSHLSLRALTSIGALYDKSYSPPNPFDLSLDGPTTLYVRMNEGTPVDNLVSKAINAIRPRLTPTETGQEKEFGIWLQPLKAIYLDRPIYAEFCVKGNSTYLYVFILLGVFLIIISSINYINLSIAEFQNRAKEIGVRKVMGVLRKQIAFQVLLDAILVLVISAVVSIVTLYLILPDVREVLDPNLEIGMLANREVLLTLLFITGALLILSTAYPAWHLALNSPVHNMKSIDKTGSHTGVSKVLLVTQFTISIICITATLIIGQQLKFINDRNPGYDRDNLIVAYMPEQYPWEKNAAIKSELEQLPGVESVSFSTFRIAGAGAYRDWYRVETEGEMKRFLLHEVFFDHDFFKATGIPLVSGRSFDLARVTDAHEAFIVNEAAVRMFGWKDALGKRISYGFDETEGEKWEGTIVGVVKDFNISSLHSKIEPLVMRLPWSEWAGSCVHIRVNGPLTETIARIQNKYSTILPGFLLHYSVVSELYSGQYSHERKAYAILQLGTWIVAVISCLGIFSLSLYLSMRRTREFGIRKVLGATTREIALLHTNKFVMLGLIANTLALPIAWIISNRWLDQFAYKTEVSGLLFLVVAFLSLVVVIISAGYSALKSGMTNPMEVIKAE